MKKTRIRPIIFDLNVNTIDVLSGWRIRVKLTLIQIQKNRIRIRQKTLNPDPQPFFVLIIICKNYNKL